MFATYFACKLFVFLRFGYANLLKLTSAGQFAGTNQNSQRRQDASHRWTQRPGEPDRGINFVRASTQTDQDGPFALPVCVGPLEMPLGHAAMVGKDAPSGFAALF
jgi:hypothetical protein